MRLKLGRYYRTESGIVAGPLRRNREGIFQKTHPFRADVPGHGSISWRSDGTEHERKGVPSQGLRDLVAEAPAPAPIAEAASERGADSGLSPPTSGEATKYDADKPDFSLLPFHALAEVARALQFGERKYSRYNYRGGFAVTRLARAAIGHVMQWLWVEDVDPESGVSHLGHAGASIIMLLDTLHLGTATDNRDVARMSAARDGGGK